MIIASEMKMLFINQKNFTCYTSYFSEPPVDGKIGLRVTSQKKLADKNSNNLCATCIECTE